jgi:hypothetical protein
MLTSLIYLKPENDRNQKEERGTLNTAVSYWIIIINFQSLNFNENSLSNSNPLLIVNGCEFILMRGENNFKMGNRESKLTKMFSLNN